MSNTEVSMDQKAEPEKPPLPLGKEEYLDRLNDLDRSNVLTVCNLFSTIMSVEERNGFLLAVGGTVTKPGPRKDIDLLVVLHRKPEDPKKEAYLTTVDFYSAKFSIFQELIETMLDEDSNNTFKIDEIVTPYANQYLQNPNIVESQGTITLLNREKGGSPIQLSVTESESNFESFLSKHDRPAVLLTTFPVKPLEDQLIPIPTQSDLETSESRHAWLNANITKPPKGYEDLKHPNGIPYTVEEQIEAFRKQISDVVDLKLAQKTPLEEIVKMLIDIVDAQKKP